MLTYKVKFNSSFENTDRVIKEIHTFLTKQCSLSDKQIIFKIDFVLRELLNNAVEHGNKMDFTKNILCILRFSREYLLIRIIDQGEGFTFEGFFNDNPITERKRGISTIAAMGFNLCVKQNRVTAKLCFS
ncbi:MAG: ATP-binding protein [Clostridia bacterium]|nr:ATP-binding protein [Clostridia bacterium]